VRLFKAGMNLSVMSWNAASNNQALNSRQTGYILNSISAYRTAQDNKLRWRTIHSSCRHSRGRAARDGRAST